MIVFKLLDVIDFQLYQHCQFEIIFGVLTSFYDWISIPFSKINIGFNHLKSNERKSKANTDSARWLNSSSPSIKNSRIAVNRFGLERYSGFLIKKGACKFLNGLLGHLFKGPTSSTTSQQHQLQLEVGCFTNFFSKSQFPKLDVWEKSHRFILYLKIRFYILYESYSIPVPLI